MYTQKVPFPSFLLLVLFGSCDINNRPCHKAVCRVSYRPCPAESSHTRVSDCEGMRSRDVPAGWPEARIVARLSLLSLLEEMQCGGDKDMRLKQ